MRPRVRMLGGIGRALVRHPTRPLHFAPLICAFCEKPLLKNGENIFSFLQHNFVFVFLFGCCACKYVSRSVTIDPKTKGQRRTHTVFLSTEYNILERVRLAFYVCGRTTIWGIEKFIAKSGYDAFDRFGAIVYILILRLPGQRHIIEDYGEVNRRWCLSGGSEAF